MTTIKLDPPWKVQPKKHICSICEREFTWEEDSAWFGSMEKVEEKTCSLECQKKSKNWIEYKN